MPNVFQACLIGAVFACTGVAAAQEVPAGESNDEIVVTGTRDLDSEIRDFVGALAKAPPRGQLSRFERAVCPAAIGLSPGLKQAVVRRLQTVAKAASIDVGQEGCTPNVLVIVTPDKPAFLQALLRGHSYYFGNMPPSEKRRLVREPGPATAWQLDGAPLNPYGVEVPTDEASGIPINRTTRAPSRITPGVRPQFAAAAVVIEAKALEGLTTTQLADYAAMRVFARTDPARLPAVSPASILKVLDAPMGSEVPVTLTAWDLGFLRGLYTSDNTLYAGPQRSEIAKEVNKSLEQTAAEPE